MENILDLYHLPCDSECPLICMDEKSYQLLGDVREPIPMRTGRVRREDYDYSRNGTCSIFVFTEPLTGWRHVTARHQRTRLDWAEEIAYLLDEVYPHTLKIKLIMDNLNTHGVASLYAKFSPSKARRLAKCLEIHYTPVHGSWLNIAEIELSVMSKQCLHRRINTIEKLNEQLFYWESQRNSAGGRVNWQYTTTDARIHLRSLYPRVEDKSPNIVWFKR